MPLTLTEARQRAGVLSRLSYDLDLDLTGRDDFRSVTTVRFDSAVPEAFLELRGATSVAMTVNGEPAEAAYDGRRLPLAGLLTDRTNEVVVDARIPYVTDGDGMHTFTDPADGERYVSAYLGLDVAQRVFACFDQNDLKATVAVSVTADPAWTVLSNGSVASSGGGRWEFARTPPIPPSLVVVCAGPWHSVRWEHRGLPFGWHARRSLAAELDRDAAELRTTTEACFDHYAELFTEPYVFDSYDQAFVPGLNWGAQEMPGCVTYRDELLPRGAITDRHRRQRAMVIAHEMAHMWFGDDMTMTWWEDTWLQESFADYMGYRVAADGAGFEGTLVDLEIGRKPWGYDGDRRRSTHPVAPLAEEVPDVDAAAAIFDAISYAKGNACLRQLATWLGDEEFLAGINAHLTRFHLGNATLADFVDSLDSVSGRDVRRWVELWLRRSGHDTIRVGRDGDVPVLARDGLRPHAVTVAAYDDSLRLVGTRPLELDEDPVALPEYAGLAVVPNAHGETFAALALDEHSWSVLSGGLSRLEDPLVRAVLWSTAFRLVRDRELSADAFLALVGSQLPAEPEPSIVEAVLARARYAVVPARVPAAEAAGAVARIAGAAAAGLADAAADDQRALAHVALLAATSPDSGLLRRWLADGEVRTGGSARVPLLPSVRWRTVARLAELGEAGAGLVAAERERDGSFEADLGAARALAARPTEEAKAAAWASLAEDPDVSNRHFSAIADGLWSPEQADLLRPYVAAYLAEAPRLAKRGQAFEGVVGRAFPALHLDPGQLDDVRAALAGDVPVTLRRAWEDRLDDRA
ncbi:aminopeptidase N [Nocardioides sp. KR10-350]|uniref:aminopeptidase N n=1 Tax=Nocardioides cheoyonin TaxID=3156615 RepID=UPI0032B36FDC